MRDIKKVIAAIIPLIPITLVSQSSIIGTLERISKHSGYDAPETNNYNSWLHLCNFLGTSTDFNPITEDWQQKVSDIITDKTKI